MNGAAVIVIVWTSPIRQLFHVSGVDVIMDIRTADRVVIVMLRGRRWLREMMRMMMMMWMRMIDETVDWHGTVETIVGRHVIRKLCEREKRNHHHQYQSSFIININRHS